MSLRIYLSTISFITIATFTLFLYLFFGVDPLQGNSFVVLLLIGSFSISLLGMFTLARYYLTQRITHNELYYANFIISLREGIIFGLYACSILTLSLYNLIGFFDGVLMALAFVLFELYFLAKK